MTAYINYKRLESAVNADLPSDAPYDFVCLYSMAVSLKKIADKLDGDLFTQPVNQYGESFTDAIQNGFVCGQRGISTWDE